MVDEHAPGPTVETKLPTSAAIAPTPFELVIGAAWLTIVVGCGWLVTGVLGIYVRDGLSADRLVVSRLMEGWVEAAPGSASCLVAGWLVFAMLARYHTRPDSVGPLLAGMLIRLVVVFAGIAAGVVFGVNQTGLFWASFVVCYLISLAFEAVWLTRRPLSASWGGRE